MGVSKSYSNKKNSFFPIFLTTFFFSIYYHFILTHAFQDVDTNSNNNTTTSAPSPPPSPGYKPETAPFLPSVAIVVAVLTTTFSITFLLLLYAKHCKRGNNSTAAYGATLGVHSGGRKNAGIDRAVVESLPIFRFGWLMGQKEGLECAVCLSRFEPTEVLRLLPKCKHAFHVECADTWLDAHCTCPLCRYRVDPEDVLLIQDYDYNPQKELSHGYDPDLVDMDSGVGFRRVSGRHSSAECERERERGFSLRRSLDGCGWGKKSANTNANASGGNDSVAVGCFDRYHRKDGMLLTRVGGGNNTEKEVEAEAEAKEDVPATAPALADLGEGESVNRTRLEHRISVSGVQERWSDVQPSDLLLYLRQEMIATTENNSRRCSSGCRPPRSSRSIGGGRGRSVINGRNLSEITGREERENGGEWQ